MRNFSELDKTRIVRLDGAHNARDIGGFRTADGGVVSRGLAFRSDELSGLSDTDVAALSGFGIRTVVDFRSKAEIARSGDKYPRQAKMFELGIESGDLGHVLDDVDEQTGPKLMKEIYRLLVREHAKTYSDFFSLLMNGGLPLLFHCTAGKDRTGFAAAMLLSALGVSREDIFHDYMMSAEGAGRKFGALIEREPRLASLVAVRPEYLGAAFDEIELRFGTTENYLTGCLGVDLERMREIFVK